MTITPRRSLILFAAVAAAGLIGALAAWFRETPPLLTFVVFTLTTAPVLVGAAWALTGPPDGTAPRYPEQSVEQHWMHRAGFGAFCDLVTAMGVAAAACAVLGLPEVPLAAFLVLGGADLALRYHVLSRRVA